MDAFISGIAINLASDLVKAGARRVRDAALGDAYSGSQSSWAASAASTLGKDEKGTATPGR